MCGEVTYEASGPYLSAWHCHCSQCRKAHGAAYGSYAEFKPENFKWLSGGELVKTFELGEGGYCFCSNCGSSLAGSWKGKIVQVTFGTMEGDPEVHPDQHIFVGSKASWDTIADDLPQNEKWPPGSPYEDT